MVYRQWGLFSGLIGCLFANIVHGQEVKLLGVFGDRAFVKVDDKSAVIRAGQHLQGVKLKTMGHQQVVLVIDSQEVALSVGQVFQSTPPPLVDAKKPDPVKPKASINIFSNLSHQFVTNGVINGRMVTFLVDTGASSVSMSRKQAQRIGLDFRTKGKEGLSNTANGAVKHWQILLNSVKVGAITLSFVEATIRDTDDDLPILLGMSFLNRVQLEQSGQKMVLTEK